MSNEFKRMQKLAGTPVKEEKENLNENKLVKALKDEAKHPDSKIGASILNKYAKKIETADKKDYRKILTSMENELIKSHPDTFSGDDDMVNSFMSSLKESLNEVYVAGGIVGVGAINHPKREKSDYEMAFEHFMTEGEEKEEKEVKEGYYEEDDTMEEGMYEEDDTMEEAVAIPAEASAIRDAVRKMMKDHKDDADLGAAIRKKFAK